MFYYGLDFHDLAPDSILHISVFIIMCEAFLRIPPHFGLWLKTFSVKPKVVDGEHVECGGAVVSKLTNTLWPKGSFTETPTSGSENVFMSWNPIAPSGQLFLCSVPALRHSLHHGLTKGWTGDQLMKWRL